MFLFFEAFQSHNALIFFLFSIKTSSIKTSINVEKYSQWDYYYLLLI